MPESPYARGFGPADAEQLAVLLHALADRLRLRIVNELAVCGPMATMELAAALSLPQPTLSHHMPKLEAVGLVSRVRRGQPYVLNTDALAAIGRLLTPGADR